MINRFVGVGRLTKDPELRYTPSGLAVVRFTLAINRQFTGENGEREADFINCVAWRKQAENLANFQKKGNLLGIEGRIQTGSYEGQDGKKVYTTEVVADSIQFLEPRNGNSEGGQTPPQQGGYQQQQQPQNQQPYGGQQQTPSQQQQYYSKAERDPFAPGPGGAPLEVSESDLPF